MSTEENVPRRKSLEAGRKEVLVERSVPIPERIRHAQRRRSIWWAVTPLPLLDAVCMVFSVFAAYYLRFQVFPYYNPVSPDFYIRLTAVSVPVWLAVFALYRLYHPEYLFGGLQEYASVFNACTAGLVGMILYGFLDRQGPEEISRGWLVIAWGLSVITTGATRFLYRRVIYRLRRRGLFTRRTLIVGTNNEGQGIAAQLRAAPEAGMEVVGFLTPTDQATSPIDDLPVWNGLSALGTLIRQLEVEEVIVVPRPCGARNCWNCIGTGAEKTVRAFASPRGSMNSSLQAFRSRRSGLSPCSA
jgi:FlaA1/EpsC-like NDP-sugar epimerase